MSPGDLDEPLLVSLATPDGDENDGAFPGGGAIVVEGLPSPRTQPSLSASNNDAAIPSTPLSRSSSRGSLVLDAKNDGAPSSFYGRASMLGTGMLFHTTSARGVVDALPDPSKPNLFLADFCPYSMRAWIALLEKEDDVRNAKLFGIVHVCFSLGRTKDPGFRLLKKLGHSQVPVLLHEGNIFAESQFVADYLDNAIVPAKSLKPADPVTLYNMHVFIERHEGIAPLFHDLLMCQNANGQNLHAEKLLDVLKTIDSDLQMFNGPYLCGEEFTLADVNVFPFLERVVLVLSHYRNFYIPANLKHLLEWYEAVSLRPSVKVTTADRTEESMKRYCFEKRGRQEYLIECYECYFRDELDLFKRLNEELGSPGVNAYHEYMEDEWRDKRLCENKSCQKMCMIS